MKSINFTMYSPGEFFDVKLVFSPLPGAQLDSSSMLAHRAILAWQIPYFKTLFSFPGNEERKEFTISVEDPAVAKLFLLSFYGQEVEWTPRQKLQTIKLKSFFCLNLDVEDLYDMKIAREDFPLLCQILSLPEMPGVDSDEKLRTMVRRNVPPDYDWRGLDLDFKNIIKTSIDKRIILSVFNEKIALFILERGKCSKMYAGHTGFVKAVVILEEREVEQESRIVFQRRMISASCDKTLRLWDLESGDCLCVYRGHGDEVYSVVVLPDQRRMVSLSKDGTLRLWDIESGECLSIFYGHAHTVGKVAISSDQKRIISGTSKHSLGIWDIKSGLSLRDHKGHVDSITSVEALADEKRVISASLDFTLRLWNLENGECLRIYRGHSHTVMSVVLLEDPLTRVQTKMISASYDKTLRLWDIEKGECLRVYKGHKEGVSSATVLADQKRMISSSHDHTLRLWDIESGECLQIYIGHDQGVYSALVLADQKRMISRSYDGTVRVWDIERGKWLYKYITNSSGVERLSMSISMAVVQE